MSADDNAPEQAREVEVVARVLVDDLNRRKYRLDDISEYLPVAEDILRALAPIRGAERQEAARAAWDDGYFHGWDDESFEERGKTPNPYRADGVTGRSGT